MERIKLSIVVPVYNMEKYLDKCVQSLLAQSLKDIEIILVDDGSQDTSGVICDRYAGQYENIKVIHKSNGGLVSAWKEGVKNAKGEFVGFCDSDDYCDADYFECLYSGVVNNADVDMVLGTGYIGVNQDGKVLSEYHSLLKEGIYEEKEIKKLRDNYFDGRYTVMASRVLKIIRKSIIINNFDLFDNRITRLEDLCATFICLFDTKKLAVVNTLGYRYVVYEESMSHGFSKKSFDNFDYLYEYLPRIAEKKGYKFSYRGELLRQCIKLVLMTMMANISSKEKIAHLKDFRKKESVKYALKESVSALSTTASRIVKLLFSARMYNILLLSERVWRR